MSAPNSISRGIKGTYRYDPNEEKINDTKIERLRVAIDTSLLCLFSAAASCGILNRIGFAK
jgi:hypothetical protein